MFVTSLAGLSMGLFISASATTQERATTLVPFVLIPQIIFAGVMFDLSGLSEGISYFSIARWSVEGLGTTAHLEGAQYAFTSEHLATRWLILLTMAAVLVAPTIAIMARRRAWR